MKDTTRFSRNKVLLYTLEIWSFLHGITARQRMDTERIPCENEL